MTKAQSDVQDLIAEAFATRYPTYNYPLFKPIPLQVEVSYKSI